MIPQRRWPRPRLARRRPASAHHHHGRSARAFAHNHALSHRDVQGHLPDLHPARLRQAQHHLRGPARLPEPGPDPYRGPLLRLPVSSPGLQHHLCLPCVHHCCLSLRNTRHVPVYVYSTSVLLFLGLTVPALVFPGSRAKKLSYTRSETRMFTVSQSYEGSDLFTSSFAWHWIVWCRFGVQLICKRLQVSSITLLSRTNMFE